MLAKVRSQPLGLDQSLDLSLVLEVKFGLNFGLRPKFSLSL